MVDADAAALALWTLHVTAEPVCRQRPPPSYTPQVRSRQVRGD